MAAVNLARSIAPGLVIATLTAACGSPVASRAPSPRPGVVASQPPPATPDAVPSTTPSPAPSPVASPVPTAAATLAAATRAPAPALRPAPPPTIPPAVTTTRFGTLPPGSALPGDASCAVRVPRSPWEPRPGNAAADSRVPPALHLPGFTPDDGGVDLRARALADRVTGNFSGTTDEIIRWASCKWGFDEDIVRAVAVAESDWDQATVGDLTGDPSLCATGYPTPCPQSFGLLQVKWTAHPGTFPWSRDSTAFNVDYALMWRRVCYEGWMSWVNDEQPGAGYEAGDEWGCVGLWYSGSWKDAAALSYVREVRHDLSSRPWLTAAF